MEDIKRRSLLQLVIAIMGVFVAVYGLRMFNQHLLMQFAIPARAVIMISSQWLLFLVPGILMLINKEKISDLGFTKDGLGRQILIGVLLALAMSAVLTVLPILAGFKEMVGSTNYKYAWQFLFEFAYTILGVALVEELIFRGYIFRKLLEFRNSRWLAIIFSSLLFGFFHIFNGDVLQVLMTAVMGFIYCMFRERIKGCTLLSLILVHGIYDALITLWVAVL